MNVKAQNLNSTLTLPGSLAFDHLDLICHSCPVEFPEGNPTQQGWSLDTGLNKEFSFDLSSIPDKSGFPLRSNKHPVSSIASLVLFQPLIIRLPGHHMFPEKRGVKPGLYDIRGWSMIYWNHQTFISHQPY